MSTITLGASCVKYVHVFIRTFSDLLVEIIAILEGIFFQLKYKIVHHTHCVSHTKKPLTSFQQSEISR